MYQFIKKEINIYKLIWKYFQDIWLCKTELIYSWTGKALFLPLGNSGCPALTLGQDKNSKINDVLFTVWNCPRKLRMASLFTDGFHLADQEDSLAWCHDYKGLKTQMGTFALRFSEAKMHHIDLGVSIWRQAVCVNKAPGKLAPEPQCMP